MLPAGNIVGALYKRRNTQSSAPEDGWDQRPKHVELIGIINKPLLLRLVGCLYYLYQYYIKYKKKLLTNRHTRDIFVLVNFYIF